MTNPPAPGYPIRAVARATGLSVDTLRAWERRYGAVQPSREGRGRSYSEADIARLRTLAQLVDRGHAIGSIATLPDTSLRALVTGGVGSAPVAGAPLVPPPLTPLTDALDRYEFEAMERALNRFATVLPVPALVFDVVIPLLRQVGQRWEAGTLRPAQEHLISASIRSVLGGLLRTAVRPVATPIVFAGPAHERHELGLLAAALLAASAGHSALYLGPDLPGDEIAEAAARADARVIVLAVTLPPRLSARDRKAFQALARTKQLWIGGPAAAPLLHDIGNGAVHVPSLDALVPMLDRHDR